ncbi:hypothetical protein ACJJTC_011882 [Scirpophaga incertulas]
MALSYRIFSRKCNNFLRLSKPSSLSVNKKCQPIKFSACHDYQTLVYKRPLLDLRRINWTPVTYIDRTLTSQDEANKNPPDIEKKKPGLIQKFKQMYRDYWYVLVPVHLATSAVWLGSFYYAVRSGVDVLGLLESLGVSETLMAPLRDSSAGYVALTYALYKIATPLRYAVTIGGTTFAINKLTSIGWIKPVPSRERLKEMLQEKKDTLQDRFNESKQHYHTQMKEKREHVMDEVRRYKSDIRDMKNKVKKM